MRCTAYTLHVQCGVRYTRGIQRCIQYGEHSTRWEITQRISAHELHNSSQHGIEERPLIRYQYIINSVVDYDIPSVEREIFSASHAAGRHIVNRVGRSHTTYRMHV